MLIQNYLIEMQSQNESGNIYRRGILTYSKDLNKPVLVNIDTDAMNNMRVCIFDTDLSEADQDEVERGVYAESLLQNLDDLAWVFDLSNKPVLEINANCFGGRAVVQSGYIAPKYKNTDLSEIAMNVAQDLYKDKTVYVKGTAPEEFISKKSFLDKFKSFLTDRKVEERGVITPCEYSHKRNLLSEELTEFYPTNKESHLQFLNVPFEAEKIMDGSVLGCKFETPDYRLLEDFIVMENF